MSYQRTKTVNFGPGRAGLSTVGYTLRNADGTVNTGRSTSGVVEIGTSTGMYGAPITFPSAFAGYLEWDTGEGSPVYASEDINPGADEYSDVATSTRAANGAPVTFVSPLSVNGADLTLIGGDDYGSSPPALQRFLWTLAAGEYPDLTGGSVALYLAGYSGAQGTGVVVTGSATADQAIAVDFTATQTAAYPPGDVAFTLVVTTSGGAQQSIVPAGMLHCVARAGS